jgi:hypothetical protein
MEFLVFILKALGIAVFYLAMFFGVAVIPLGLAGEFVIVIATGVFILVAGSEVIGWWVFATLLLLGIFAEVVEFLAGMAGAKVKGSFWSGVGAIVGGVLGGLLGASVALIVGGLVGAFAGTFAGAFAVEWLVSKRYGQATHVATLALIARIVGTVVKVVVSLAMIGLVTLALLL